MNKELPTSLRTEAEVRKLKDDDIHEMLDEAAKAIDELQKENAKQAKRIKFLSIGLSQAQAAEAERIYG